MNLKLIKMIKKSIWQKENNQMTILIYRADKPEQVVCHDAYGLFLLSNPPAVLVEQKSVWE